MYRVRCDDGRRVTATLSTEARRVTVQVLPGDKCKVIKRKGSSIRIAARASCSANPRHKQRQG
jgi:ribosomal protein L36